MKRKRTFALPLLALLLAAAALAVPSPARAWWRGGVFFGFPAIAPFYYAPPPIAYPPLVYAPPPAAYAPPYYGQPYATAPYPNTTPPYGAPQNATGPACYAGQYVCPLETPAPAGSQCTCPTNAGSRIVGRVG